MPSPDAKKSGFWCSKPLFWRLCALFALFEFFRDLLSSEIDLFVPLVDRSHHPAWRADRDDVRGDVARDHAARAYDRVVPYRHSGEHYRAGAYPAIFAYAYRRVVLRADLFAQSRTDGGSSRWASYDCPHRYACRRRASAKSWRRRRRRSGRVCTPNWNRAAARCSSPCRCRRTSPSSTAVSPPAATDGSR